MAKHAPQQSGLFKKEIPEMPKGYYSSGPNPNLKQFVEEHATPYNPATDDYDVPPFDKPIKTTKATAIYNMHTYWSKKPHDAIREYIQHYTQPSDLVLDPFCGSGGTALAALMEGRKAIAIDLSPAATFITKNYCTPVDVDELQRAYEKLEAAVKPEMDWLYETRCDRCDGRAMTNYTVWSYVFECPRCLNRFPLFDCPEIQQKINTGKIRNINVCPTCYSEGNIEEIKAGKSRRFNIVPVKVVYTCLDGCVPKKSERLHNDSNNKKKEYFDTFDKNKISEIEKNDIPYWFPQEKMLFGLLPKQNSFLGDPWYKIEDLYTKRNLWALAILRNQLIALFESSINSQLNPLWQTLTTSAFSGSLMLRETKRAIQAGTYYIPPISREIHVFSSVEYKAKQQLRKAYIEMEGLFSSQKSVDIMISTQSALNLQNVQSNSIDYIFTDPPYSGKVQYGELNFLWEKWLGFPTDWLDEEIIINPYRGKSEEDWIFSFVKAFQECFRVLKPGHWISLCYHDSSEGTWQLVQDVMSEIGFISDQIENVLFIDAKQKSYKQVTAQKVTKRDLVINFRKPRLGETRAEIIITGEEDDRSFSEKAYFIISETLERIPGSSTDTVYDELVSRMVRKGEFERHNFDALLRTVAEEVATPDASGSTTPRWYLLETAGEVDAAESRKEEAASDRLEAFMVDYLEKTPEFEGVHYSDLFEQYLPVQDKPRRLLADWLPEFFFRTPEGTWRPPLNDEEHQQKQQLRASGTLRRVKRFANAISNSVPPAAKDRPENPATLASWINQCRRAGLYDLGKLLYEQGGHSFDNLSEKEQLQVQENYLICSRRSQAES